MGFDRLNEEIKKITTDEPDVYSLLDSKRNDFLHGNRYWKASHPIILNLICLLIIDEITPLDYDNNASQIKEYVENVMSHFTHDLYPPDLEQTW